MTPFSLQVVALLHAIPEGRVATYGTVAAAAGRARAARQVVRLLHSCSEKYQLPWHRVVNRDGQIVLRDAGWCEQQRQLLAAESVELTAKGRVDLARFGVTPEALLAAAAGRVAPQSLLS